MQLPPFMHWLLTTQLPAKTEYQELVICKKLKFFEMKNLSDATGRAFDIAGLRVEAGIYTSNSTNHTEYTTRRSDTADSRTGSSSHNLFQRSHLSISQKKKHPH
jgi:hypothetical protein